MLQNIMAGSMRPYGFDRGQFVGMPDRYNMFTPYTLDCDPLHEQIALRKQVQELQKELKRFPHGGVATRVDASVQGIQDTNNKCIMQMQKLLAEIRGMMSTLEKEVVLMHATHAKMETTVRALQQEAMATQHTLANALDMIKTNNETIMAQNESLQVLQENESKLLMHLVHLERVQNAKISASEGTGQHMHVMSENSEAQQHNSGTSQADCVAEGVWVYDDEVVVGA